MRELLAIPQTHAFVAEGGKGFALIREVKGEAEILTLAVREDHRRQGIGEALVAAMRGWATQCGIKVIFLEVRERNAAAQALYAKAGFAVISKRKAYYHNRDGSTENAVILRCRG